MSALCAAMELSMPLQHLQAMYMTIHAFTNGLKVTTNGKKRSWRAQRARRDGVKRSRARVQLAEKVDGKVEKDEIQLLGEGYSEAPSC